MRQQPKWTRARAVDQPPSKTKRSRYDRDNSIAARVILDNQDRHPNFMVEWARQFTARRAEEKNRAEVDRTPNIKQSSGQIPLDLREISREPQ